jgi:hypothetical protein
MAVTEDTTGRYVLPEGVGTGGRLKPAGIALSRSVSGIGIPIPDTDRFNRPTGRPVRNSIQFSLQ